MRADVFISQTESGGVEISVVKHGLVLALHDHTSQKAREVLLAFRIDAATVDRQLGVLSKKPPSVSVRFPTAEIVDDLLGSLWIQSCGVHGRLDHLTTQNRPAALCACGSPLRPQRAGSSVSGISVRDTYCELQYCGTRITLFTR